MPGEWAATGGAAISGEDSYTAANRELFEELSIKSNKSTLKKILRIKRRNSLLDIWVIVWTLVSQVLIIIGNYILSKLIVFKNKEEKEE